MAETKKRQPLEVLNHQLHTLATEGYGLTRAERLLIEDWQGQLDEAGVLSPVQEDLLHDLYTEHT